MDEVQKPIDFEYYTPLSEPFRINMLLLVVILSRALLHVP
jgi:hypothetical protein